MKYMNGETDKTLTLRFVDVAQDVEQDKCGCNYAKNACQIDRVTDEMTDKLTEWPTNQTNTGQAD